MKNHHQAKSATPRILSGLASLALTAALIACQPPASFVATPSSSETASLTATPFYNSQTGELKIRITLPFEPDFRTQAVQCNSIYSYRVTITGVGIDSAILPTSPTPEPNGRISGGNCEVTATFASLPAGQARILTIEGYNNENNAIAGARIKGLVDLNPLPTGASPNPGPSSAEVSHRTTPAAEVIEKLIQDHGDKGKQLISKISSSALKTFIDSVTGVSLQSSSPLRYNYTLHPTLVNSDFIAADLVAANGDFSQLNPSSSRYQLESVTVSGMIYGLSIDDMLQIRVLDPLSQRVDITATDWSMPFSVNNITPGNWTLEVRNLSSGEVRTQQISSSDPNLYVDFTPDENPPTPSPDWAELNGPLGGSVNDLARLSGTPSLAFAATTHGVYKSTNATSGSSLSWELAGTDLIEREILSVYVKDAMTIYAGTRSNGLYKSTDGGSKWNPVTDSDLTGKSIYRLVLAGGSLHAATSGGVLVQGPGPAYDWTPAGSGPGTSGEVRDLSFNGSHLAAVIPENLNAGVYQGSPPVTGWSTFNENLNLSGVKPLSVTKSSSDNLIVAGTDGRTYGCTFTNSPTCWEPPRAVSSGAVQQLRYLSGPNQFVAASLGEGIKISEPDINYKLPTSWLPAGENGLNNPFALGFDSSNTTGSSLEGLMGLTDGGGVSELINAAGPLNWQARNQGLKASTVRDLVMSSDSNTLFVATEGGGVWRYNNSTSTWTPLLEVPTAAGSERYVQALALDHNNNLYAAAKGRVYLLSSATSNTSWALYSSNLPSSAEIVDLQASYDKIHAVVKNAGDQGVYSSCSYGSSDCFNSNWSRHDFGSPVYSITASSWNQNHLFVGLGNGHVWESNNGGASWPNDLGSVFSGRPVAKLAAGTKDMEITYLFAASEGANPELKAYNLSFETWSNNFAPGLDGDEISALAVDSSNADHVAVGTRARGVYHSFDALSGDPGWTAYNEGSTQVALNRLPVSALVYTGLGLYTGTEGRGVYRDLGTEPGDY